MCIKRRGVCPDCLATNIYWDACAYTRLPRLRAPGAPPPVLGDIALSLMLAHFEQAGRGLLRGGARRCCDSAAGCQPPDDDDAAIPLVPNAAPRTPRAPGTVVSAAPVQIAWRPVVW